MRLRSGLAISFSFALAAAIAFACSSFEASEVPPDGGTEATHGPDATDVSPTQDGGVDVPPRRWCADQDATFCDDFDELDASFEPHWHEVEVNIDGGVVARDDRTWRSSPLSVRMEATSPQDGGLAVARLVKTVAPTKEIEVAFDMYVVHVGAGGAAPLGIKCAGPSEERVYGLFVTVASPSASDFGMHFADGAYFYFPVFSNKPSLRSWRRVFLRLGVTEPRKPFLALDDPTIDLIPASDPLALVVNGPISCSVFLGVSVTGTSASIQLDNVIIRTL